MIPVSGSSGSWVDRRIEGGGGQGSPASLTLCGAVALCRVMEGSELIHIFCVVQLGQTSFTEREESGEREAGGLRSS